MARGRTTTSPDELSGLLVAVRKAAGLSQTAAGERAGIYLDDGPLNQARVSRAEQGLFPLSPAETEAFARACGASDEQRRTLVRLARDAQPAEATAPRPALQRNGRLIQRRIAAIEQASSLIRGWQPEIPDGMLQTRAWTNAAFGVADNSPWWEARSARLALLDEPGREWHLIMSEAALRWNLADDVMAGQAEHLIELSRRPNVRLGLVELTARKVFPPPAAFHLYDTVWAVTSTPSGAAFINIPSDLDRYADLFRQVDDAALYGDDARALLATIRDDYRR